MTEKSKGIDQVKFEETNLLLKQITANGLTKEDERYMQEFHRRFQDQKKMDAFATAHAEKVAKAKEKITQSLEELQ